MRKAIKTAKAPVFPIPFSQAVIASGKLVFASGMVGVNPETKAVPEKFEDEVRQVLDNLLEVLLEAGCGKENVVKCTCFMTDVSLFEQFNATYGDFFGFTDAPARSTFEVSSLPGPYRIEIEAVGHIPE